MSKKRAERGSPHHYRQPTYSRQEHQQQPFFCLEYTYKGDYLYGHDKYLLIWYRNCLSKLFQLKPIFFQSHKRNLESNPRNLPLPFEQQPTPASIAIFATLQHANAKEKPEKGCTVQEDEGRKENEEDSSYRRGAGN